MLIAVGVSVAGLLALCALGSGLLVAGLRAGDRPVDAEVAAWLASAAQPDEQRPVIVVTIRNPSTVPLIAGLSATRRRIPHWLDPGMTVTVPRRTARRRTARRRLRAGSQDVVGLVPAGAAAAPGCPRPGPLVR